jgi:hypothetical protein
MPGIAEFHMDDYELCQLRLTSGGAIDWRMYFGEIVRHNQFWKQE